MTHWLQSKLTDTAAWLARPWAFVAAILFVAVWLVVEPKSFDWHGIATVVTLFMTLFIQRAEHRDTQALHAKLDELLRAQGRARGELTRLDDQEPEQVESFREKAQAAE